MEPSRRSVLLGTIGLGSAGAVWFATTDPLFGSYESYVSVRNKRTSSVSAELTLRNRDENEVVLDESFTLAPEERFHREGVMSKNTEYRLVAGADELVFNETFRTCCRGYMGEFAVRPTELEVRLEHMD